MATSRQSPKGAAAHQRHPNRTCGKSGKVKWSQQAAVRIAFRMAAKGRYTRNYKCGFCGWWHLSSQEPRQAV